MNNKPFVTILYNSNPLRTVMSQLTPLVHKLSSPIPQIQSRTLSNIYMKISHNIISQQQLAECPELPGLLMSWINENKRKSDTLVKVLYILLAFTKSDKGKILLRRYECLEFCEEFRVFLVQTQRAIQVYLDTLDEIIRRLLPLGRAIESQAGNENIQLNTQAKNNNPSQQMTQNSKKWTNNNLPLISQHLRLVCPHLPLQQSQQKIIFQHLMQLKYAKKETIYMTLTQIRVFVVQHHLNTYRCKPDLFNHLIQLCVSGVYPELCVEIMSLLLRGLFEANKWVREGELGKFVNLTYGKVYKIEHAEVEITVPFRLFNVQASFIILKELVKNCRVGEGVTSMRYLLAVYYQFSADYFMKILQIASQKEIAENQATCIATVEKYCQLNSQKAQNFINLLPHRTWQKIKILNQFANYSEKQQSLSHISDYLSQKFQPTKNLHLMRQIIDNLKSGIKGCELKPKQCAKLYIEVLATLAISVSKQDPIMSYYSQAQELFIELLNHSSQQVVLSLYEELFQSLTNIKNVINYPGLVVPKSEVIEILFSSPVFVKQVIKCSLDFEITLTIMFNIIVIFVSNDKFKCFYQYIPIIFALCGHPSQQIAAYANKIISKIPKNYSILCIACKIFSSNPQIRKKLLTDLLVKPQPQIDIIERLSLGHFVSKKKPLKISKSSIDNYFNIILNPTLQITIKEEAINEFIDCMERMEGEKNKERDEGQQKDLSEARACLVEQIRKINKKQKFDSFSQKLILLHLLLQNKMNGYGSGKEAFGVQSLIGLLGRTNSPSCRSTILSSVYQMVFQSPFTEDSLTKSYVMMYFPHVQVIKMKIEHPVHHQQAEPSNKHPQQRLKQKQKSKQKPTFSQIVQLLPSEAPPPTVLLQSLQEQLITAITTTDIPKISKLSFLAHYHPHIKLSKSTAKIIQQYVRTNSIAIDLADDLMRILSRGEEVGELYGGHSMVFIIGALRGRTIGNQEIERLMKDIGDVKSKCRLFAFLNKENGIKFGSFNEYNSLKLIQSIISQLRSPTSFLHSRILSLTLLYKISSSEFNLSDHMATLLTLLHTILFENKPTLMQFCVALTCYSQLLSSSQLEASLRYSKMTLSAAEQMCTLIANFMKQWQAPGKDRQKGLQNSNVVMSACFQFLNDLMRIQVLREWGRQFYETIANQSHNMIILATTLLPKNIAECSQKQCIMVTQIFTFLYLYTCSNEDAIYTLLNSTDIISVFLGLIASLSANRGIPLHRKAQFFDAVGKFVHNLTSKPDQFIFKANRILRNEGGNSEYKLHYTLMAPIPILSQYYQQKQRKITDPSYIRMVSWLFFIWKQESAILQEIDFIQPLVSCALHTKQVQCLSPLLTKSGTAQKLVAGSSFVCQKFKYWIKIANQLIFQKSKASKKIGQSKIDYPQLLDSIKQGLIFATTVFTPTPTTPPLDDSIPQVFQQTVQSCLKLIDQVHTLLQLISNEQLTIILHKLVTNVCHNELCSKIMCAVVGECGLEMLNRLLGRVEKCGANVLEVSPQLQLLAQMSCNESVRSLVIKHRVIDNIVAAIIAMDENKVAKINYGLVYCVASFLCYMSEYKDTNAKIQNDKKLLDIWSRILALQQSQVVEQKILQLLINLSAFKHSKSMFMASKEVHKTCLGLLSEPEYENKEKVLCLIYNILYKNAAGIRMYRRPEVVELFQQLREVEELADIVGTLLEVLREGE